MPKPLYWGLGKLERPERLGMSGKLAGLRRSKNLKASLGSRPAILRMLETFDPMDETLYRLEVL